MNGGGKTLAKGKENKLFWDLWQNAYPTYKKIYPTMNPELYAKNLIDKANSLKKIDILICGSGDEDSLLAVMNALKKSHALLKADITLLDFCGTALKRNMDFAKKSGLVVNFVYADILKYQASHKFDVILSDGIIDFFNFIEKKKLLKKWNSLLKEDGLVLTTIPINGCDRGKVNFGNYYSIFLSSLKKRLNPIKKIAEYSALRGASGVLTYKYGKNTAYGSVDDFKVMCGATNFQVEHFKQFYSYDNPVWDWFSCVLSKREMAYGKDRLELIFEVGEMVSKEKTSLFECRNNLNKNFGVFSKVDSELVDLNVRAIIDANSSLDALKGFVEDVQNPDSLVFSEIIKWGNYAFRKSIYARTSFLRHTPTLNGLPVSLQPFQNHVINKPLHTVDYGRGGYALFQTPTGDKKNVFKSNPELDRVTQDMAEKIYGGGSKLKSLIFTCGLGAANTFYGYMESMSTKNCQLNYLGDNCWIELRKQANEEGKRSFCFFDESDEDFIVGLLKDDAVQSISLEGVQNYPTLTATNFKRIFSAAGKLKFKRPKFIFVDNVMTFDKNPAEFFGGKLPKNLCVAFFISGIKFFQGGWDISKSGFLFLRYNAEDFTGENDVYQRLLEIRAVSGNVPSIEEAYLSDIDTKKSLFSRMGRYDRNMEFMAKFMDAEFKRKKLGKVYSAWLPEHDSHKNAMKFFGNGGRVIYLKLDETVCRNNDLLELYREIGRSAHKKGVPLLVASNFGFCCANMHIVRHAGIGLSLRLSAGSVDLKTLKTVCGHIVDVIGGYVNVEAA